MKDIKYVIESDTGKEMTDLFMEFDKKPLGAASLAQVYFSKWFVLNKSIWPHNFFLNVCKEVWYEKSYCIVFYELFLHNNVMQCNVM